MNFVDTNYFLRLLLEDNISQNKEAKDLFLRGAQGVEDLFTSGVVIFEIYWVLASFYEKNKAEIAKALEGVLEMKFIYIENREIFEQAIRTFKNTSLDLEDSYNLAYAKSKNSGKFYTFDRKLSKIAKKLFKHAKQ